ncbi:translation protein SH3-like domain-containing protein [Pisolithus sp. B1]|nr:translation protein SH3-like domain-containing protein [Pisolithus sp. B1]
MFGIRAGYSLLQSLTTAAVQPKFPSRRICHVLQTSLSTRNYATTSNFKNKKEEVIASFDHVEAEYKTYKPITPGIRHLKRPINPHLYKGKPVRLLTVPLRRKGGRNSTGRITVRFRGGGHKRRIRVGSMTVVRVEYDPGRSAHIALTAARDPKAEGTAKWKYILAPEGLRAGDVVQSFRRPGGNTEQIDMAEMERRAKDKATTDALAVGILSGKTIKLGNCLPLRLIPTGTVIHCISLNPQGKAILVRSAGTFAQVLHHEEGGRYSHVRLQSGEIRKVLQSCVATVGKVSNAAWHGRSLGKAGRNRWLGWRPRVRGVAMNACDHPHGGGRGKSKSNKHPVSVWGWPTKGKRTRKPGPKGPKNSNKMVLKERPRGKEKRSGASSR